MNWSADLWSGTLRIASKRIAAVRGPALPARAAESRSKLRLACRTLFRVARFKLVESLMSVKSSRKNQTRRPAPQNKERIVDMQIKKSILGVLLSVCAVAQVLAQGQPLLAVRGHGTWLLNTGDDYANHQPYIESTSIDARINNDGTVEGTIVWMHVYNGPTESHGRGFSGCTWKLEVDRKSVV